MTLSSGFPAEMRLIRSMWIWTSTTVLIVCWAPLLAAVRAFDRDPLRRKTSRWFRRLGRAAAKINPAWRVHIAGSANIRAGQVYVIVSNHQSLADIPLISHLKLDTKWLAKAELFEVPVFGWMLKMSGDVPVQRSDRRKAAQSLLQCARYLRQGCSVVFFPEGTRSPTGEVLSFNDGPFQLAIREQVPVLPLVVEGTGSALPRNTWLFGDPQDVLLKVLPPVVPDVFTGWETAHLREAVRERIIEELASLRR